MAWCKKLGEASLVGVLLGIGFVVPAMWWTVFLGVGYYLYLLDINNITWKGSYLAWTVKYLLVLVWGFSVYPMDWLGDFGTTALWGIALYWVTSALWLGSGAVVFYVLYQKLKQYAPRGMVWATPFLWLLAELCGALVFSIMLYGPGGSIGAQFSFGFVGYHLAQHELLLQLAAVAGVYGLTLVTVALALVGRRLFVRRAAFLVCVVGVVVTSFISIPAGTVTDTTVRVAAIDTVTPNNYWQSASGTAQMRQQLQAAYTAAQAYGVDYVVLPEDSNMFDHTLGTTTLRAFQAFRSTSTDPVVIDSGSTMVDGNPVLQAVLFDPADNTLTTSHKRYLVPQGEYMPIVYDRLLRVFGFGQTATLLQESFMYRIGPHTSQSQYSERLPGVLFCFESVDPRGVRNILKERDGEVPFVAHIVSHAWFDQPQTFRQQLQTMLRVQAVWNDTYIVAAGNHLPGFVVTPRGQVQQPTPIATGEHWQLSVTPVPVR